jgi:hypothetical protein
MNPMPTSPLAAVFIKNNSDDYIVVFYLLHYASDDLPTRTDVYASVLSKTLTADADTWSVSTRVLLTA